MLTIIVISEPLVGIQFECLKDAFEFYKRYSLKGGFGCANTTQIFI